MLSKEEIENMKDDLKNLHHMLGKEPSISKKAIENVLQYIEQQETDKQKIIEKLEEDIVKANEIINDQEYQYIEEVIDEQWERRKYALEILKIVKG